jgi:hypothetical protein
VSGRTGAEFVATQCDDPAGSLGDAGDAETGDVGGGVVAEEDTPEGDMRGRCYRLRVPSGLLPVPTVVGPAQALRGS